MADLLDINRNQQNVGSGPVSIDSDSIPSKKRVGAVEDDTFVINDISLRIPPTGINIVKNAYNKTVETLRTISPRRLKSGQSTVEVTLAITFIGEDINNKLIPLVAGLRATPFCVVNSPYLQGVLANLEAGDPGGATNEYKRFQSLALAMTSMTFETSGGSGVAEGIQAELSFLWFNYYPYMPIFAFKVGENFDKPGYVSESTIWKAFYQPFMAKSVPVSWPHKVGLVPPTVFTIREFLTVPRGSKVAYQATSQLIDLLENKPSDVLEAFTDILNNPKMNLAEEGVYDLLYREAVLRGKISIPQDFQNRVGNLPPGSISEIAAPLLNQAMQKMAKAQKEGGFEAATNQIDTAEKLALSSAASVIQTRLDSFNKAEQLIQDDPNNDNDGYQKILSIEPKAGVDAGDLGLSTLTLLGRKRRLILHGSKDQSSIIEHIRVTFKNSIAMIPMAGYRHPTLQHLGSIDFSVEFLINATNEAARDINTFYDISESMSLRFKQVPQPWLSVFIQNDFLGLFGLSEFMTENISTQTITGSPGRSRIALMLSQPGLTMEEKLEDKFDEENAKNSIQGETIKQEFVQGANTIYKGIWTVLEKYLAEQGAGKKQNGYVRAVDQERWNLVRTGITQDTNNILFVNLIDEGRDNYNKFLENVHSSLFGGKRIESKTKQHLTLLYSLSEFSEKLGFIPGIQKVQESVRKRYEALRTEQTSLYGRPSLPPASSIDQRVKTAQNNDSANQSIRDFFKQEATNTGSDRAAVQARLDAQSREEAEADRNDFLDSIGLQDYQVAQRNLFQRITEGYLSLEQFKHLAKFKDQLGLNKGIMAYPDFKKQLSSVAGFVAPGTVVSNATLNKYDPDTYLWYPIYNGPGSGQSIENYIDPAMIAAAKWLSLKSYNQAQDKVDSFFSRTYLQLLDSDWDEPYKRVLKESAGKIVRPYGSDIASWSNATRGENIKLTVIPDTNTKLPSNFYLDSISGKPLKNPSIQSSLQISHSTNMSFLWNGVSTNSNIPKQAVEQGIERDEVGTPRVSRLGDYSLTSIGSRPRSQAVPNKTADGNIYCPIESYTYIIHEDNPLYIRPIDMSRVAYKRRASAALNDWTKYHSIMSASGEWFNPHQAPNTTEAKRTEMILIDSKGKQNKTGVFVDLSSKIISQWTYDEYQSWVIASKGRKIGYLHKGMDIAAFVGTDVYAALDGKVTVSQYSQSAGLFIEIEHNHPQIKKTRYLHLKNITDKGKVGQSVFAGDCIALSGETATVGSPHLHFETLGKNDTALIPPKVGVPFNQGKPNNAQRYVPSKAAQAKIDANKIDALPTDVTATVVSPMTLSIEEFGESLLKGQGQGLMRAYPTFKLYFVEDDSENRKRLAFDDFFSYNSVQSIRVVRSRKIAADICELYLTNISGILSNRKFRQQARPDAARSATGAITSETTNAAFAGTSKENPIASLLLQEGTHIHLRLGYATDPDLLDTVFNGVITEIEFSENEDLIRILAQSYAVELVQDIKGIEKPIDKSSGFFNSALWGFADDASSGAVLENMLAQPEVLHFGRWDPVSNSGINTARNLLTNRWTFKPQPQDDNIFPPPFSKELERLDSDESSFFKKLKYVIYRTTIWDVCKEMELRHPNYVCSPVPYKDTTGERMTLFFGLPNQLYFARAPTGEETIVQSKIKAEADSIKLKQDKQNKNLSTLERMGRAGDPDRPEDLTETATYREEQAIDRTSRILQLEAAKQAGYIKPFRNYHLITSGQHIVYNNIQANSRDVANTVVVKYVGNLKGDILKALSSDEETFTLKLDSAIPAEETRTTLHEFINVYSPAIAKQYALSLLAGETKEIYQGELCILGNGKIKPYDIVYLFDEISDMLGPIEVEEVQHVFDKEHGFITEIKPDMLVQAAEWSITTSSEAMGVICEGVLGKLGLSSNAGTGGNTGKGLGYFSWLVGLGLGTFGGFMTEKILTYTQFAHPIVMSPLMHHGRLFTGGVPVRKLPHSIWNTIFGDWNPAIEKGWNMWVEDTKDEIIAWAKGNLGFYTQGDFFNNENTLGR